MDFRPQPKEVLVACGEEVYAVLAQHARLSAGLRRSLELPVGSLDAAGTRLGGPVAEALLFRRGFGISRFSFAPHHQL